MKWLRSRRERQLDDFADAIRPELTDLPVPAPTDELWDRVLASRAAGVRGIVPDVTPRRRRAGLLGFVSIAAAATIVALLPQITRRGATVVESPRSNRGWFGEAAFAQEPPVRPGSVLPPAIVTRASALRPISIVYARRVLDTLGRVVRESRGTLAMDAQVVNGVAAWRVVAHEPAAGPSRPSVVDETLYVARADLRLLSNALHETPYSRYSRINVEQRVVGDSLFAHMTAEGSGGADRRTARRLDPARGPYLVDSFAPLFLGGVTLSPSWSGRIALLGWAIRDDDISTLVELRVVGQEVVATPAGRFDSWRLSLRVAGREISYWVRKRDGVAVKLFDDSRRGANIVRDVYLVSER